MPENPILIVSIKYHIIMAKHLTSHFSGKLIHDKTFAVVFLYTYIADGQGHDPQEKICD